VLLELSTGITVAWCCCYVNLPHSGAVLVTPQVQQHNLYTHLSSAFFYINQKHKAQGFARLPCAAPWDCPEFECLEISPGEFASFPRLQMGVKELVFF
jgi:hypothetical protein